MAAILPALDWARFRRRCWNGEAKAIGFHVFACGDEDQAVVWLLRRGTVGKNGRLRVDVEPRPARLHLPCVSPGRYCLVEWDTSTGERLHTTDVDVTGGGARVDLLRVHADRALTLRRKRHSPS